MPISWSMLAVSSVAMLPLAVWMKGQPPSPPKEVSKAVMPDLSADKRFARPCPRVSCRCKTTGTLPANGKFTPRQRQVYDAVLRVFRGANQILRPGNTPLEYQKGVVDLMEKEMIGLGLFTAEEAAKQGPDKPLVKKYFMHGTSHHMGLDVHDVCPPHQAFDVGMVFTIEPGIYIREENLGVRIENDVVIGEESNFDLMANIPIEADEIEALMSAQSSA